MELNLNQDELIEYQKYKNLKQIKDQDNIIQANRIIIKLLESRKDNLYLYYKLKRLEQIYQTEEYKKQIKQIEDIDIFLNQKLEKSIENIAKYYIASKLSKNKNEKLELLEKGLKLQPNNLKLLLAKAKVISYWNEINDCVNTEKKYQDSIELFKKAILIDQNYSQAYFNIAKCYSDYYFQINNKIGQQINKKYVQLALEYIDKAIKLNPSSLKFISLKIFIVEGPSYSSSLETYIRSNQKQVIELTNLFIEEIKNSPNNKVYIIQNRIYTFFSIIEVITVVSDIYDDFEKLNIYNNFKQYNEVLIQDKFLDDNNTKQFDFKVECYEYLIMICLLLQQYSDGQQMYQELMDFSQTYYQLIIENNTSYTELYKFFGIEDFDQLFKDPTPQKYTQHQLFKYGLQLEKQQEFEKANKYYELSYQCNQKNQLGLTSLIQKAVCFQKISYFQQALTITKEVIKSLNELQLYDPFVFYLQATILKDLNQYDQAIQFIDKFNEKYDLLYNKLSRKQQMQFINIKEDFLPNLKKELIELDKNINQKQDIKELKQVTDFDKNKEKKEQLVLINYDDKLLDFYKGFLISFSTSYTASQALLSGQISIDTSNLVSTGVEQLISLIPLVGSQFQSIMHLGWDTYKTIDFKHKAVMLCQLAPNHSQLDILICELARKIIFHDQFQYRILNYDLKVQQQDQDSLWFKIKSVYNNYQDQFDKYTSYYNTPIKQFALEVTTEMIGDFVTSGYIYQDKNTQYAEKLSLLYLMSREEKVKLFESHKTKNVAKKQTVCCIIY